jgi:NADPH:quinone reductase-like Zn-dependent oxidoreductase
LPDRIRIGAARVKAAIVTRYGPPDVVRIVDRPDLVPRAGQVLVQVGAAGVTTADWRMRAGAFPDPFQAVVGRLAVGFSGPRNQVLGGDFAGRVAAIGPGVADFAPGDRVFGFSVFGAHAEQVLVRADGAITRTPDSLTDTQAAALPFAGQCALEFLDRYACVTPGQRVLVVGATGGVGAMAVQVARVLGATVTGVCSAANLEFLRALGAETVLDYRQTDPACLTGPFDVVFDTIGRLRYADARRMLAPGGRFVPLNFGLRDGADMIGAFWAGHRVVLRVNADTKAGMERIAKLVNEGRIRPVIDAVLPFDAIREAHARVQSRHRRGSTIVVMQPEDAMAAGPHTWTDGDSSLA